MPKYKVLKPIEHNQTLYLPETGAAPANAKSVGHGMDVPVNASGTIEIEEAEASNFVHGQIATLPEAASSRSEEPKRQRGRTQQ